MLAVAIHSVCRKYNQQFSSLVKLSASSLHQRVTNIMRILGFLVFIVKAYMTEKDIHVLVFNIHADVVVWLL